MADNFDMKKFLVENKLGAYSKLKNEGEAAYEYEKGKAAGEKEEKAKLTKDGGDEDKLPLTPKMKKFIDKVISDAKKDGEFEELVQVDYFENDLIDFILEKFDDESDYDDVSQEVKDYINKSVKDYYKNPDGTPFFSEDLGQDRTDAEAEKMMDFLYEKEKTEEALSLPAAQHMGGLVSQTALKALVNGTQTIIRDLKQDGFESDEIFEYIVSIIKDLE